MAEVSADSVYADAVPLSDNFESQNPPWRVDPTTTFKDLPRSPKCEIRSVIGRGADGTIVCPVRCQSWQCIRCAALMTTVWAVRVAEADPQRMFTFTHIGETREQIRRELQHITRDIRRAGYRFEYWGVIELHQSMKPHIHLLQKGRFVPKAELDSIVETHGWGRCDARKVSQGWSAAWYCGKHLCHSHQRRWNGRLIRYSRGFFNTTAAEFKQSRKRDGYEWEMRHGRADDIAELLRRDGEKVLVGDMGEDWIMGESLEGGVVKYKYNRDEVKGYIIDPLTIAKPILSDEEEYADLVARMDARQRQSEEVFADQEVD